MIFIIGVGLVMLVLLSFLCYYSRILFALKLLTLPVFLLLSGMVGYHYVDNLGKPIERTLPDKFDYQHHRYVGGEYIYVWLTTKEKGDLLYKIPYNRDDAKALEKAKEERDNGGTPGLHRTQNETGERPQWEVTESENISSQNQETK